MTRKRPRGPGNGTSPPLVDKLRTTQMLTGKPKITLPTNVCILCDVYSIETKLPSNRDAENKEKDSSLVMCNHSLKSIAWEFFSFGSRED